MSKGLNIEIKSFGIIESSVDFSQFDREEKEVIKRVIHATGDIEFRNLLRFSSNWKKQFKYLVENYAAVVCDVAMVKTGITDRFLSMCGLKTYCFINDEIVLKKAAENGFTRAELSAQMAFEKFDSIIFVIGNAPTFLLKLLDLAKTSDKNIFVIGVPVGFVMAAESKKKLERSGLEYITNVGTKGGSPVAASIFNACVKVFYETK